MNRSSWDAQFSYTGPLSVERRAWPAGRGGRGAQRVHVTFCCWGGGTPDSSHLVEGLTRPDENRLNFEPLFYKPVIPTPWETSEQPSSHSLTRTVFNSLNPRHG